jgi:ribosome-associated toxin RatA of RatAB toxin-antitoxin module
MFAVAVDVETSDFHRRLFTRFEGEWSLSKRAEGVLITMTFDFDTKYGPFGKLLAKYLQYKAPSLIEQIFDGWEAEIEARLTEPKTGGTEHPTEKGQSN